MIFSFIWVAKHTDKCNKVQNNKTQKTQQKKKTQKNSKKLNNLKFIFEIVS